MHQIRKLSGSVLVGVLVEGLADVAHPGVVNPVPFAPSVVLMAEEAATLLMLLAPAAAGAYRASDLWLLLLASCAAVVLAVIVADCCDALAARFAFDSAVTTPGLEMDTHV